MLRFVPFALCVVGLTGALIYSGSHAVPLVAKVLAWPLILWVWTQIEPTTFALYVTGPATSFLYSMLLWSPLLAAAVLRKWWPCLIQLVALTVVSAAFVLHAARYIV